MHLNTMLVAAGALALTTATALAQSAVLPSPHMATDPFTYRSDKDLEGMAIKPGVASPTLGTLSDHENYYVLLVGRTETGEPEFHAHWIDYGIVQEGQGGLVYGGIDTGSRDTGNGELRGGTISGGVTRDLNPGDYFEIPAGQWHQITLKPTTKAFRYIVVKVRQ
jgi:mannose-6-phosphate isomerase-like protein (cupin superfamily)